MRTYRFVNDLDVTVELDVSFTDIFDDSRSRVEDIPFYINTGVIGWPPIGGAPGGQTTQESLTVSSGTTETYSIPVGWDVIIVNIDPSTAPSTGSFKILDLK